MDFKNEQIRALLNRLEETNKLNALDKKIQLETKEKSSDETNEQQQPEQEPTKKKNWFQKIFS